MAELKNLRCLDWTLSRNSSGTAGNFLKAYSEDAEGKWYWKLSNYAGNGEIVGHECLNEMIADRLMEILEIPHLQYELFHAVITLDDLELTTYLVRSKDYKYASESKMALDQFYDANRGQDETSWDFVKRMGWKYQFYDMFLLDYLILNRDRHGANIEVLFDRQKNTYRLSPIFDNGLSLMFSLSLTSDTETLNAWDILADRPVNNFVGSLRSTQKNLELLPAGYKSHQFVCSDQEKDYIFQDVREAMPEPFINRVWTMITERWKYYDDFQSNRRK